MALAQTKLTCLWLSVGTLLWLYAVGIGCKILWLDILARGDDIDPGMGSIPWTGSPCIFNLYIDPKQLSPGLMISVVGSGFFFASIGLRCIMYITLNQHIYLNQSFISFDDA